MITPLAQGCVLFPSPTREASSRSSEVRESGVWCYAPPPGVGSEVSILHLNLLLRKMELPPASWCWELKQETASEGIRCPITSPHTNGAFRALNNVAFINNLVSRVRTNLFFDVWISSQHSYHRNSPFQILKMVLHMCILRSDCVHKVCKPFIPRLSFLL